MKKITIILVLIVLSVTTLAFADGVGPNYVYGDVIQYSTVPGGLLVLVNAGIPNNCAGTPYNWMIISQDDKAILAVALMKISQDRMGVGLYSTGVFYQGFCRVTQLESTD